MTNNDTSVFKGHRDRMRAKLRSFGTRYFETYELLEMLLFSVIARKNTHPTAKLLIKEFKTLDALFSAKADELLKISGVGKECADFIADAGALLNLKQDGAKRRRFSGIDDVAAFFHDYFLGKRETETVLLSLDANLSLIECKSVYSLDLSSGAVQPKPFIDAALKAGASVCAVAHNHPHGSPFPTDGDWESDKMLKEAFREAGIATLDGFVSTNEGCKPFTRPLVKPLGAKDASALGSDNARFSELLSALFLRTGKDFGGFLTRFSSPNELFELDIKRLGALFESERTAELIAILGELASRKITERFKLGRKHSEDEIKEFLCGFFLNFSSEAAVILPLRDDGCVISAELISDGSVNSLNIIPRLILEKLAERCASRFILAHNHPGGTAEPSAEDVNSTKSLAASLKKCGASLDGHYVVAKNECNKIQFLET